MTVSLESADGKSMYASAVFAKLTPDWQQYSATLRVAPETYDPAGRLSISFPGPGTLLVDVVSLLPEDNALKGGAEPWPFREDLVQRMRDLKPR